uniref:Uncharacterized protein n=1 Tax=viral metagenome TaxID=1070528 RepID=A0A6M3M930_9ZZZZ
MLDIRDATKLYKILASHLPEEKPEEALDFIGQIVESIIEKEQHSDFTDAIILIYGKTLEELSEMLPQKVLALFVKGLEENKVILLQDFMQKVGFNASD